jgi:hypothetical protein
MTADDIGGKYEAIWRRSSVESKTIPLVFFDV